MWLSLYTTWLSTVRCLWSDEFGWPRPVGMVVSTGPSSRKPPACQAHAPRNPAAVVAIAPRFGTAPPSEPGISITVQVLNKALAATIKFQLCRASLCYHFSSHQTMVWKEYCWFSHDSIVSSTRFEAPSYWLATCSLFQKLTTSSTDIAANFPRIKYTERNF
jgi:hypothetical protein